MATLPEWVNAISWNALFQQKRNDSFTTSNIIRNMVSCVWYLFGSQWTESMYLKNTFKCLTDVPIPLAITSGAAPPCRTGHRQHFDTLFTLRTTETQIWIIYCRSLTNLYTSSLYQYNGKKVMRLSFLYIGNTLNIGHRRVCVSERKQSGCCHQMETFPLCEGNPPVRGGFP